MHSVNALVSQQLMIVGINLGVGGAIFLGSLLGPLGNQVAESNQVNILFLLGHAGQMLAVGDAAAADKADLYFCHWDLLLEF